MSRRKYLHDAIDAAADLTHEVLARGRNPETGYSLFQRPMQTLSEVPLYGVARGIGEKLGLDANQALWAERLAALGIGGGSLFAAANAVIPDAAPTIIVQQPRPQV